MHSIFRSGAARAVARTCAAAAAVDRSVLGVVRRYPVLLNVPRAVLSNPAPRFYCMGYGDGGGGVSRRAGDWDCTSCNHLNFGRRDSCQRCGNPRGDAPDVPGGWSGGGGGGIKVGDWYCGGCNAHNFASRSACFKCGADKDESFRAATPSESGDGRPGWKSGDWLCKSPGCSEHNFASRTVCFRCSAPRDDQAEASA